MRSIRVHQFGGPEVLVTEEIDTPTPGPWQALVRVEAAGVNYLDINQRSGSYPGGLPFTPGLEAAGVVTAVGPDVSDVRVGDRVAYAAAQPGGYAEMAVWPVDKLIPLPPGVTSEQAAAALFQGLTAHYLTHSAYDVQAGDHILAHAAAGGVGLLLIQMAKQRGAWVVGVVSTEEKAALACEAGADEIILSPGIDIAADVRRLTDGAGVHAVYDSVGQVTFAASLDALRRRGTLVLFGQASGPVPPLDPGMLAAKGSLTLTRPVLFDYTATREELLWRTGAVLGGVAAGRLALRIDHRYSLDEAAAAHARLESRASSGKVLLIP
jgi:NADPH2:quinone reductase